MYTWPASIRTRPSVLPQKWARALLLKHRVSNNVGRVKHFWGALARALRRAPFRSGRRFCLCLCFCHTNQGSLVIDSGQETRSDPSISSVTLSIMITTSNSPVKGSGIPNQLLGAGLHTIGMSGLSRVRTEVFQLLVNPSLTPHPVQTNRQSPRHSDLGDLPSSPQH